MESQSLAPASRPNRSAVQYHSNPFAVSISGLKAVFAYNGIASLLLGLWLFLGALILYVFLIGSVLAVTAPIIALLGALVFILWCTVWWAAHIALVNASFQAQQLSTQEFFSVGLKVLPKFVLLNILTSVIVVIGLVLLIIPGLILAGWFALAPYAMIAENLGPIAALKRSRQLAKGHVFEIFGALFASSMMAGQGLLGTIAITSAMGARYEEIKNLKESGAVKPRVHWLNFVVPVVLSLILALIVVLAINDKPTSEQPGSDLYQNELQYNSNTTSQ